MSASLSELTTKLDPPLTALPAISPSTISSGPASMTWMVRRWSPTWGLLSLRCESKSLSDGRRIPLNTVFSPIALALSGVSLMPPMLKLAQWWSLSLVFHS